MLYVSTRNPVDSFTAHRALCEERTPDGGWFIPMRFPSFTETDLEKFSRLSFGETVAYILNLFFKCELTGWDIDSCVGRHPYKLVHMNHKLLVCELWHNHKLDYTYLQKRIYKKLLADRTIVTEPTFWFKIVVGIAVLCALWGEVASSEQESVDISISTDEMAVSIALYFAKRMGLPVGKLIYASKDDSALWELLNHAETNCVNSPIQPMIEYLLYDLFGWKETASFIKRINNGKNYSISEENAELRPKEIYASVIGERRIDSLRTSIYRSCGYIPDKNVTLSFGGLQNYRAQTGCSKTTLLLEVHNPAQYDAEISNQLGISKDEMNAIINNI